MIEFEPGRLMVPPTAIPRLAAVIEAEFVVVTLPVPRRAKFATFAAAIEMFAETLMLAAAVALPTRRVFAVTKPSSVLVSPSRLALSAAPRSMFLAVVFGPMVTMPAVVPPEVSAAPTVAWSAVMVMSLPEVVSAAEFEKVDPVSVMVPPEVVSAAELVIAPP